VSLKKRKSEADTNGPEKLIKVSETKTTRTVGPTVPSTKLPMLPRNIGPSLPSSMTPKKVTAPPGSMEPSLAGTTTSSSSSSSSSLSSNSSSSSSKSAS